MRGCARVCTGVGRCGQVWGVWAGVGECGLVFTCVWDEFSEFLPENRVPTSADFNTYPIRIFFIAMHVLTCTIIAFSSGYLL